MSKQGNASTAMEQGAYRVARGHGGGRLSGEVVELDGGDTLVHTGDDTLGDLEQQNSQHSGNSESTRRRTHLDGLEVVHVEAIAELVDAGGAVGIQQGQRLGVRSTRESSSHLVKGDELTAAICEKSWKRLNQRAVLCTGTCGGGGAVRETGKRVLDRTL